MIKYLLKSDYIFMKKKLKKHLLVYFSILLVFILFGKNLNLINTSKLYLDSLGLKVSSNNDFISILIFLYHNILIIYFQFLLFTKDLKNSPNNLFLRIRIKKWYFIKALSIIIFTIGIKFILHLFITVLFYFLYKNLEIGLYLCLKYFIISFIYTIIIENILMIVYLLKNKIFKFLLISIILVLLYIKKLPLNILLLTKNISLVFIILCVLFISNILLFSKNYLYVFEKEA